MRYSAPNGCGGTSGGPRWQTKRGSTSAAGQGQGSTIPGACGRPVRTRDRRGTTLVPTDTSYASRMSTGVDTWDAGDAPGRIYTRCLSAGGRKVAGSNPVAPITRKPALQAGLSHFGVAEPGVDGAPWYQPWYHDTRVVARDESGHRSDLRTTHGSPATSAEARARHRPPAALRSRHAPARYRSKERAARSRWLLLDTPTRAPIRAAFAPRCRRSASDTQWFAPPVAPRITPPAGSTSAVV